MRGRPDRYSRTAMPIADDSSASTAPPPRGNVPLIARFRLWRERSLPRASYQVTPRFWTPDGLQFVAGLPDWRRRALKSFEPQLTGLAYTPRRVYLVIVAASAGYEHAAKLLHAYDLIRADPDYADHRGKRISMVLLCDSIPTPVADFAHRHRVRVIAAHAAPEPTAAIVPGPESTAAPISPRV
jgi:hypothetical protein